jgi:glycosyltransferase involved in cell wall biosynthesis
MQHDAPDSHDAPDITAVLCTFNRAHRVERAARAVLDQQGCAFELVVVDDGSTDGTPEVLGAIDDPRMRVVRRPNGGLSRARNSGLAAARGRWVTFIDDDDLAEPGWLASFIAQADDPSVAIACCGIRFVDETGRELSVHRPAPLGEPFPPVAGSWLAGSFAVRSDVARRAGGYLDGLGTRHQTELFIRLLATLDGAGLRMASADNIGLRIEQRGATDRPIVNPRRLYDGTRWILARHPTVFAGKRNALFNFEGVLGANAARLGDWRAARRRFWRSVRARPYLPTAWGRVALASVPPVGARVWNRHGDWASHDSREIGVLAQGAGTTDTGDGSPELFLTWRYRENTPTGHAAAPVAPRPTPARAFAARLARRRRWSPVVDVPLPGRGAAKSGDPGPAPGLTLVLDVLERADDPLALLHDAARLARGGPVLVSTPDRDRSDPDRATGPPADAGHRREWSPDQLELLLHSAGFDLERTWHVGGGGSRRRSTLVALVRPRADDLA